MRLKLDENMPRPLAEAMREAIGSNSHSGAVVLRPRDANQKTIVTLAHRVLALVADIDMKNRIAIFDDERIRIRPPLAIVTSQG
ncbi:MAG: hypothetical protein ACREUF_04170 [Solimonas sp.]